MGIIQHIAFNCLNIKKQEAFYTKHFGFRRARVFNPGTPNEFVMLRLGNTRIELFSTAPGTEAIGHEQLVGFKHLAFEVPDLDETIAKLQADGIQTEQIIDCSEIVSGMRVCFFNDPEGNRLELMQGYQDEFTD